MFRDFSCGHQDIDEFNNQFPHSFFHGAVSFGQLPQRTQLFHDAFYNGGNHVIDGCNVSHIATKQDVIGLHVGYGVGQSTLRVGIQGRQQR